MGKRFYHAANRFLRIAFRLGLDLEVSGVEHIPRTGPLIVAINHSSFIDALLVGAFVPRDVVMMSKVENFHLPFFGWLVQWYGAFPIQRGEVDRAAFRKALDVLRNGGVLLMAPEGTRSIDGQLQPGHDGLALFAARTHAPVLPFAIAGSRQTSQNLKRLRRTRVRVNIGEPFTLDVSSPRPHREELARVTNDVMLRLAELLPPEQRGVYRAQLP
jgi:1-acyl-sn-glycerol-3-phosphate acyltransferase